MADANYSLSLDQAVRAADRFKEFDITWFEEPMDPRMTWMDISSCLRAFKSL